MLPVEYDLDFSFRAISSNQFFTSLSTSSYLFTQVIRTQTQIITAVRVITAMENGTILFMSLIFQR